MSLKITKKKIKSNFWIAPAICGIAAVILALLTMKLDRYLHVHHQLYKHIPSIFLSDKELAHSILSALSTSLLTMTTITFSSVLVVQTTFLSQFSPRTLQNFNESSKSQRVLGTFVGGYIYTLVLLLQVRKNDLSETFIVPSFAVLVAFICVGMFVFLIHHVMDWIKVGNLISNITKETLLAFDNNISRDKKLKTIKDDTELKLEDQSYASVISSKRGYLQFIDTVKLVNYAEQKDIIVKLEKDRGKYVDVDTPLFKVWGNDAAFDKNEMLSLLAITDDQESVHDVDFGIQKLVEIALRGIAPGKNDPETAINCIEQLSQILSKLGKYDISNPYHRDGNNNIRLIIEKPTFFDYLYKSFYQIRHYGKSDVSVMISVIQALTLIAETNEDEVKNMVMNFTEYIVQGLKKEDWLFLDSDRMNSALKKLYTAGGQSGQGDLLEIE
ncbi:Uncharacterized membrane protein [Bacillus sp. OV322]|uniref:DUF2254 domain-containing protein n=1 Tax=Bacillus sp. OV322 TaxID=1882764 RepID=UPI0008F20F3F|nr:DUF2254 domain-containing protein [Bacillus sp. OV322]SFC72589.1 Uncharacterized membrane protein [Bacillus sp. OV322]